MCEKNIETLLKRYDIEYEYGDEQEVVEGLKLFDEALLSIGYDINDINCDYIERPEIIRCKNCKYNNNCEIQYVAQTGSEFFCGAAESNRNLSKAIRSENKLKGDTYDE